ncbi:hypothetical protein LNTAR_17938 [Lentisphaera araneosa HTCC2155]|uniref:Uncharacterized protein n=1 Tax=Lentisphaera araneosa HTCC2155 TaxID=313628 RepID=A6DFS6_9BACT|nr:hypothetical protein LNTAR_17938 [Lentisphaera araneosa HTCC2155]
MLFKVEATITLDQKNDHRILRNDLWGSLFTMVVKISTRKIAAN